MPDSRSAALLLQASPLYLPCCALVFALCLHWVRELRLLVVAIVATVALNFVLKQICRMPRPGALNCSSTPVWHQRPTSSFGMPSGHSQLSGTVAVFLLLATWSHPQSCVLVPGLATLACLVLLVGVPLSRTSMAYGTLAPLGTPNPAGCHSVSQVVVGTAVGALVGWAIWYWGTNREEDAPGGGDYA